jgi:ATP-dependent Clp protease adaptor protein ClpS
MHDEGAISVADPAVSTREAEETAQRPRRQPRYHVVLWDDDEHSYEYVIRMMRQLFGHSPETGYQIAKLVDRSGRAICLTTTREHAELKRDQIAAFDRDELVGSRGSMIASIEPATND